VSTESRVPSVNLAAEGGWVLALRRGFIPAIAQSANVLIRVLVGPEVFAGAY